MKICFISIVVLWCLSFSRKVQKRKKLSWEEKPNVTLTIIPKNDNRMLNFAEGALSELVGNYTEVYINSFTNCIPPDWIADKVDKGYEHFSKNYNLWAIAKNFFDSILDKVCNWRENMSVWLVKSIKSRAKSYESVYQLKEAINIKVKL